MARNEMNWKRKEYETWDEAFRGLAPVVRQQSVRVAAYTQALFVQACAGSFGMVDAYAATLELIDSGADFSALFVISDAMAVAAIKALSDRGRRVPEDCSVIAIDGIEFSGYICPTLTTLCQPVERLGEESVRILVDVIEGRSAPRHLRLPTHLREGSSVRDQYLIFPDANP